MASSAKPFAIYHEHPDWFRPLFKELERRGLPIVRLDPRKHWFDPGNSKYNFSLLFNRMSPSAYLRDGVQGTFFTLSYLAHLESLGIPVVNGHKAFSYEISKALQLNLLKTLGLPYPKSRVINHPSVVPAAAEGLRFPIVVKANIGGSGAGIVRYDTLEALKGAVADNRLNFGIDHTALVQEFVPARSSTIVRVETLGRRVSLRHQDSNSGRYVQSLPGRHLPAIGRRRIGPHGLSHRCPQVRAQSRRFYAAARGGASS